MSKSLVAPSFSFLIIILNCLCARAESGYTGGGLKIQDYVPSARIVQIEVKPPADKKSRLIVTYSQAPDARPSSAKPVTEDIELAVAKKIFDPLFVGNDPIAKWKTDLGCNGFPTWRVQVGSQPPASVCHQSARLARLNAALESLKIVMMK